MTITQADVFSSTLWNVFSRSEREKKEHIFRRYIFIELPTFFSSFPFFASFFHSICEKTRRCVFQDVQPQKWFFGIYFYGRHRKIRASSLLIHRKYDHTVTSPSRNICPVAKNSILQFFVSSTFLPCSFLFPSFGSDSSKNAAENAAFNSLLELPARVKEIILLMIIL